MSNKEAAQGGPKTKTGAAPGSGPSRGPQLMVEPAPDSVLQSVIESRPSVRGAIDSTIAAFPNSIRVMGRDPELLRVMMDAVQVIQYRPGRVDRSLLWLVGHVASRAGGCQYCAAHTVAFGWQLGEVPIEKIEAVWDFESSPAFTESERVALRFAAAAGVQPVAVTKDHFDELHNHFDDDQIIEIASFICIYAFFNRWNDIFMSPLEAGPLAFAREHLAASGWNAGKADPEAV